MIVASLFLVGCTGNQPTTTPPSSVRSDGSIEQSVAGVHLVGPPGSLDGSGVALTTHSVPTSGIAPLAGLTGAVNVEVSSGTTVVKPLTLTWEATSPEPVAIPIVAHQRTDSSWEFLRPEWTADSVSISTTEFSPFVLGWVTASGLEANGRAWLTAQRAAAATSAPPCQDALTWVTVDGRSVTHAVCAQDSGEQDTLSVHSLQSAWSQVDVSADQGLSVDGQYGPARKALATSLGLDPSRSVLLPPQGTTSFDLKRRSQDVAIGATASATTQSDLLDAVDALFAFLGVAPESLDHDALWEILSLCGPTQIKAALKKSHALDPASLTSALRCQAFGGLEGISRPAGANSAVKELFGSSLDSKARAVQAKKVATAAGLMINLNVILEAVSATPGAAEAVDSAWRAFLRETRKIPDDKNSSQFTVTVGADPKLGMTSTRQLLDARIPQTCDHPAGTLRDGSLPSPSDNGGANLELEYSALGSWVAGLGKGAVATISCSMGGVGWPDHLVFYDSQERIIGHYDSADLSDFGGRIKVSGVSFEGQIVTVSFLGVAQAGDPDLWGSMGVRARFGYNSTSGKVTLQDTERWTELASAKNFVSAVNSGDRRTAERYAPTNVVDELFSFRPNARKMWVTDCQGPFGDSWFADKIQFGERGCVLMIEWTSSGPDGPYESAYLLTMGHPTDSTDWSRWIVTSMIGVAG